MKLEAITGVCRARADGANAVEDEVTVRWDQGPSSCRVV
jgi:hypothetical protein